MLEMTAELTQLHTGKQKLELSKSIEILDCGLYLDRIERPSSTAPGNRPIYFLTISYILVETKSSDAKESFRFGQSIFNVFANPNADNYQ